MEEGESVRVLLCGDVRGRADLLQKKLEKFKAPFDVCLCVGEFSSEEVSFPEEDAEFSKTPVYFIDC
eukprot:gene98-201_t